MVKPYIIGHRVLGSSLKNHKRAGSSALNPREGRPGKSEEVSRVAPNSPRAARGHGYTSRGATGKRGPRQAGERHADEGGERGTGRDAMAAGVQPQSARISPRPDMTEGKYHSARWDENGSGKGKEEQTPLRHD